MKSALDRLIILIMIIGFFGFIAVSQSFASGRHKNPDININVPDGSGDCAGAVGIASDMNYFITDKNQISIKGGYYNNCSAIGIGSAFYPEGRRQAIVVS